MRCPHGATPLGRPPCAALMAPLFDGAPPPLGPTTLLGRLGDLALRKLRRSGPRGGHRGRFWRRPPARTAALRLDGPRPVARTASSSHRRLPAPNAAHLRGDPLEGGAQQLCTAGKA